MDPLLHWSPGARHSCWWAWLGSPVIPSTAEEQGPEQPSWGWDRPLGNVRVVPSPRAAAWSLLPCTPVPPPRLQDTHQELWAPLPLWSQFLEEITSPAGRKNRHITDTTGPISAAGGSDPHALLPGASVAAKGSAAPEPGTAPPPPLARVLTPLPPVSLGLPLETPASTELSPVPPTNLRLAPGGGWSSPWLVHGGRAGQ